MGVDAKIRGAVIVRVNETVADAADDIEPSMVNEYVPTGIEFDHKYCLVNGLKVKLEGIDVETSE